MKHDKELNDLAMELIEDAGPHIPWRAYLDMKAEYEKSQMVLEKIYRIATGEDQVAYDDTDGMAIIARLAQGKPQGGE